MKAQEQSLNFLCSEHILKIPFFQRAYVWNEENWNDLLEDLLKTSGSHFLGSIILKREEQRTGVAKKAIVIDGQQRLTTLSILIKALYDSIDDNRDIFNDAADALFYKIRSSSSNYLLSIEHSHYDKKEFEDVMGTVTNGIIQSPIIQQLDTIDEDSPRIKRCYKFFYDKLLKETNTKRIDVWDNLFDDNNKILVVIDLDNKDQEQKIFDTINSAGVRLTSTDIIKNALYQKLIEITKDSEKVAKYYEKTWVETFEKDNDIISYWNAEKSIGRLMRQNSELLLQTVATIKGIFDFEKKHTIQQLADLYKKKIEECNEQELCDFIEEITKYAKIYKEHIPDFKGTETFEYNNNDLEAVEYRVLHILDKNDISTFNPYIIYIFNTYEGNDKLIIEKLRELEKYVMSYLITKTSIKNYNKDCITFINDKTGDEIRKRIKEFNNYQLEAGITEKVSNKLGAEILFWIELKRILDDPKYDIKTLRFNYQLEHIMPQKWEENWKSVPYVDEFGIELPDNENSKKLREKKIYSLGNMTLLNGSLNAAISNKNFQEKVGDGTKKGIKKYSSLTITRVDIIENIFDKNKTWNEQTITERERNLGKEVVELWGNN